MQLRDVLIAIGVSLLTSTAQNVPSQPLTRTGSAEFPLKKGTWWVYSGTAKRTRPDMGVTVEPVHLKTEVVEVLQRGYVRATRIRGCPLGLLNSDAASAECVVAQVGSGLVYIVEPPRAAEVVPRLHDTKDELIGLLHESELVFAFPLAVGQRIGETAQLTRQCREYTESTPSCGFTWTVTTARPVNSGFASADSAERSRAEYELTWRGQTGQKTIRFTRGIGIAGFAFDHGPSGNAADVKLSEYHAGRD